jgi:hypothetical protein
MKMHLQESSGGHNNMRVGAEKVPSDTLGVAQAADRLGISRATGYRMARADGKLQVTVHGSVVTLPVLKIGVAYKVSRKALDAVIARLEATEAAS